MRGFFTRKRLATGFAALGVGFMAVDLMVTGSFFVHVGELMAASIGSFILALGLDRASGTARASTPE